MAPHRKHSPKDRRRTVRRVVAGTALAAGALAGTSTPAQAATTAFFSAGGVLTVNGDARANTIAIGRDAAGNILVDGGAVLPLGGTPTAATTALIRVNALDGADSVTVDGGLPATELLGGSGNDVLTGGSGRDRLLGGPGNDTLDGRDADDRAFGQAGNDRMISRPGADNDLIDGGAGTDTLEVVGGYGLSVDMRGAERLVLNGRRFRP